MRTDLIKIENTDDPIYVEPHSIECPFCGKSMFSKYLSTYIEDSTGYVLTQCINKECAKYYLTKFYYDSNSGHYEWREIIPAPVPKCCDFSTNINDISLRFVEIYNQAYAAEQLNLDQICGVGYRKALEFLIKDYTIKKYPDKTEEIKKCFLDICIKNYVIDERIKQVAKRAVWLGNDETHYERKWEGKDVDDLKDLINLTIHYIEAETVYDKLLQDMPDKNSH